MPCDCADTRVITSLNLRWLTFVDRKENREERIEVIYHERSEERRVGKECA